MQNTIKTILLLSIFFTTLYAKTFTIDKDINIEKNELDNIYKKYIDKNQGAI